MEPRQVIEAALGTVPVLPVRLFTRHHGDLEQRGRIVVYLTDDVRRVPVRAILHTNFGPIHAELTSWSPPG